MGWKINLFLFPIFSPHEIFENKNGPHGKYEIKNVKISEN